MTSHKHQFMVIFGYEGRAFHGVAPQPGHPTAGAALLARLAQATPQVPHALSFAARTDAGVSARINIATFRLVGDIDKARIIEALQSDCADGLVQVSARTLPKRVMARNMVAHKHYCYRVAGPDADIPPDAPVWQLACNLHIPRLRRALAHFQGRHDFTRFCHAARPTGDPMRTLSNITVEATRRAAGHQVAIHLHGDGFLRRMLRMVVFTATEAACGLRAIATIPPLLHPEGLAAQARPRTSAPARGLTLEGLTLTPEARRICSL